MSIDELTPSMIKDFVIEIKLLNNLHHPNVVKLIGLSISPDNNLHILTDLLHMGSIRDLLDKKGENIDWKLRLKLLTDAAKGMAYLHSRSVIHRDLKPRNLLVSKKWECKVADFGASTIKASIEQTMTVVGTPAYMAPEVLSKVKYSEKADIYSFGIILVEIYTGEKPYSGPEFSEIRNQVQLIQKILSEGVKPNISALPIALKQLVFDCWSEEPSLRPSFAEIIVRLRRLKKVSNSFDEISNIHNNNNVIVIKPAKSSSSSHRSDSSSSDSLKNETKEAEEQIAKEADIYASVNSST